MPKNSQSKINKKKRSNRNGMENFFCFPEPKKKAVTRKKPRVSPKATKEQFTQTRHSKKCNIATIINMENYKNECDDNSEDLLIHFPSCQDVKGLDFSIIRPFPKHISEKPYISFENDNAPENKKSDKLYPGYHDKLISETSSITLKDILDENDFLLTRSQSTPWKDSMQNTINEFFDPGSRNELTLWTSIEDSSAGFSPDLNKEDFQVYEYVETTTLLPIGNGITTLTPIKTGVSPFPIHNDYCQSKILESSSPIEIPPHMPTLLSLKIKPYLPHHLSELPHQRQRGISENLGYNRKNQFNKNNDNEYIVPFYMKTNATEEIKDSPQCSLFTYVNNITQGSPLTNLKPYEINSSFNNKTSIPHNIQPIPSKRANNKQIAQMSTTF